MTDQPPFFQSSQCPSSATGQPSKVILVHTTEKDLWHEAEAVEEEHVVLENEPLTRQSRCCSRKPRPFARSLSAPAFARKRTSSLTTRRKTGFHPRSSTRHQKHYIHEEKGRDSIDLGDILAPQLPLLEFGTDWANEILAVLHNGLRYELIELFDLLGGLSRSLRFGDLLQSEVASFSLVVFHFRLTVESVFRLQEQVLLAHLECAVSLEHELHRPRRLARHRDILQCCLNLQLSANRFLEFVPLKEQKGVGLLYDGLLEIAGKLDSYMFQLEVVVPERLRMFFTKDSSSDLSKLLIRNAVAEELPSVLLPVLVRWMQPAVAKAWVSSNTSRPRRIQITRWLKDYDKSRARALSLRPGRSWSRINEVDDP